MSTAWVILLCLFSLGFGWILGVASSVAFGALLSKLKEQERANLEEEKALDVSPEVEEEVYEYFYELQALGEEPTPEEVLARWGLEGIRACKKIAREHGV